jgi:hypothetical protein
MAAELTEYVGYGKHDAAEHRREHLGTSEKRLVESAKPLFIGSIPIAACNPITYRQKINPHFGLGSLLGHSRFRLPDYQSAFRGARWLLAA